MPEKYFLLSRGLNEGESPLSFKDTAAERQDVAFEVSVAGNRVLCGAQCLPYEVRKRSDRERVRRDLVFNMLQFAYQARLLNAWGGEEPASLPEMLHDFLGRPFLVINGERGPSVSFSYSKESVWGALCRIGFQCGIDSSRREDFTGNYPLGRAFDTEELAHAVTIISEDYAEAAAALWSAKESIVKAIGCGFNLIDPLEMTIRFTGGYGNEFEGQGTLNKKRVTVRERLLPFYMFRYNDEWVSVAVVQSWNG